ncbi:MAG: 3,4-dihydroxy-2-butanone-4-phosphate synthase [Halobacteriales archaeon]|nr:3,4-dihydroxy-2-butanone-4-phosphate synthase [Halobacteriales archaeon]
MSRSDSRVSQQQSSDIKRAVAAFRAGEGVLIHDDDDREAETDLLFPAEGITPKRIAQLRNDAGGLLFVALAADVADAFELPFLHDVIDHPANDHSDLSYDARPSFSLSVNHRDTYTGITDTDRARTVDALATAAAAARAGEYDAEDFGTEFRTPGHVHLLRAADDLLEERQGHTELGIALAEAADQPPAVVGCEMLDDETGGALSKAAARDYAARHDLVYVEGSALLETLR